MSQWGLVRCALGTVHCQYAMNNRQMLFQYIDNWKNSVILSLWKAFSAIADTELVDRMAVR